MAVTQTDHNSRAYGISHTGLPSWAVYSEPLSDRADLYAWVSDHYGITIA